jgi:hypothetical protein
VKRTEFEIDEPTLVKNLLNSSAIQAGSVSRNFEEEKNWKCRDWGAELSKLNYKNKIPLHCLLRTQSIGLYEIPAFLPKAQKGGVSHI